MKKVSTLCMVCQGSKILLGMKKRGFGEGRWNGFGGKVEEGEIIEEAAIRELSEEIGIYPENMGKVGILEFSFEDNSDVLEVHIFKVFDYRGEPQESEEMKPQWFHIGDIPFHQMWFDDEHWFPYLLEDRLFKGKFHFDRPSDAEYSSRIISKELAEVDGF